MSKYTYPEIVNVIDVLIDTLKIEGSVRDGDLTMGKDFTIHYLGQLLAHIIHQDTDENHQDSILTQIEYHINASKKWVNS